MRTGNNSPACASSAAAMAAGAETNTAHSPSPVCLNTVPACASTAERIVRSWAANDSDIADSIQLPTTRRLLDIGEQKRQRASRVLAHTCLSNARSLPWQPGNSLADPRLPMSTRPRSDQSSPRRWTTTITTSPGGAGATHFERVASPPGPSGFQFDVVFRVIRQADDGTPDSSQALVSSCMTATIK